MRYRRRQAAGRTRPCANTGCRAEAPRGRGFCKPCWYRLSSAVRLTIQEARIRRLFKLARFLSVQVGAQLGRRQAAAIAAAGDVLLCGRCERRAHDPVIRGCTDPDCPFAMRRAA